MEKMKNLSPVINRFFLSKRFPFIKTTRYEKKNPFEILRTKLLRANSNDHKNFCTCLPYKTEKCSDCLLTVDLTQYKGNYSVLICSKISQLTLRPQMRVGHLRINVPAEFLFSLPNRTLQRYGLSLSPRHTCTITCSF